MNNVAISDISRMITAIDHECAIKIKEISLDANEKYNNIKSQLITQRELEINKEFTHKVKEIKKDLIKQECKLRQYYKLKMDEVKSNLVDQLIANAKEEVQRESFDKSIIKSILEKITMKDVVVFVNEKDFEYTKNILIECNMNYEIKQLPDEGLGGVIICSKDGKEIWDNCYETRINVFIEKYGDLINKMIF